MSKNPEWHVYSTRTVAEIMAEEGLTEAEVAAQDAASYRHHQQYSSRNPSERYYWGVKAQEADARAQAGTQDE